MTPNDIINKALRNQALDSLTGKHEIKSAVLYFNDEEIGVEVELSAGTRVFFGRNEDIPGIYLP